MKKSIISLCGLLFFAAQSCDVLDKDPVEFVSTEELSQTPPKKRCNPTATISIPTCLADMELSMDTVSECWKEISNQTIFCRGVLIP